MNNQNPGLLEQEAIRGLEKHITISIEKYSSMNNYNTTEAAYELGYPRETLGGWRRNKAIPKWNDYFTLMLKLDNSSQDIVSRNERVENISDNLWNFFSNES